MDSQRVFHLVYRPASSDSGSADRIVSIVEAEDATYVLAQAGAASDLIAMQLDAQTLEEIPFELAYLGF